MALPIPGHLQRVDREHPISGRQQRSPTAGLDANQHLIRLGRRVQMLRNQPKQHDPDQPLRQSAASQQPARLVFNLDDMVGFSPIVANKQHAPPCSPI
jgi:hypothetical protein